MGIELSRWLRISLFNFLIVAAIGVILRYKIAFSLPFIDQKYLLHGHSHFAFTGWITQAIMALLVNALSQKSGINFFKKYRLVLWANLFTAYGMLVSFPLQGYGLFSIIFSTLSIFVSYYFSILYWKDLNRLNQHSNSSLWYKAAFIFNAISSIGAFGLAFMMASKQLNQNLYLAAIYLFLHFQYNGWFFFACMGLFIERVFLTGHYNTALKKIFLLFAFACVPAYFLSVLWLPIPLWAYCIVVISAIAQVWGLVWFLQLIWPKHKEKNKITVLPFGKLFILPAFALAIKILLQLGSTIPSLSTLAFGFRPIVIGYLHLVLLGIISLFLLIYMVTYKHIIVSRKLINGLWIFIAGVFINEIFLMAQGVGAIGYQAIPFINELLLAAALILFFGMFLLNYSQYSHKKP